MTVVLEDQVKTITAELVEQMPGQVWGCVNLEGIVRAVIAMYDISDIARLEVPAETSAEHGWRPYYNAEPPNDLSPGPIK